jgi:hypothetical protein
MFECRQFSAPKVQGRWQAMDKAKHFTVYGKNFGTFVRPS